MTRSSGRTSDTDPIRVDFLSAAAWQRPGRIGLTFAPGKRDPGKWDRDLDQDLARIRHDYGTSLLACLIEKHEFDLLKIPDLLERAAAHGLETTWFPIQDLSVPSDMKGLVALVDRILVAASGGRTTVIHCRGGIGRAGLVAACCLVTAGHDPRGAIAHVRAARPGAVETTSQVACVAEFAELRRMT